MQTNIDRKSSWQQLLSGNGMPLSNAINIYCRLYFSDNLSGTSDIVYNVIQFYN